MSDQPEPKDPAEVLKEHFAVLQSDEPPQYVMSERNRRTLEKIRQRVKQLRGQ